MKHMARTAAQQRGERGERLARDYLEKQGFIFLAANWRCKLGEIDLIMQAPDGVRVLVEVRTRVVTQYGAGEDTVAQQKQRKLTRAAQVYQQQEDYWGPVRFDVVSIEMSEGGAAAVQHIAHAFGQ